MSYLAGKLELGVQELKGPMDVDEVEALDARAFEAQRALSRGETGRAERTFESLLEEGLSRGLTRIAAGASSSLSRIQQRKGRRDAAAARADQAVDLAAANPPTTWVAPLSTRAWLHRLNGETQRAAEVFEALLRRLFDDDLGVPNALALVYGRLAVVYLELNRRADAAAVVADALALDTRHIDDFSFACMYLNLSAPLRELGRTAEARKCLARADQLFQHLRFREEVAGVRHNLGELLAAEGDWSSARSCWATSRLLFHELGCSFAEIVAMVRLARAEEALGNEGSARQMLLDALSKARRVAPGFWTVAEAHEAIARIESPRDVDAALAHISQALALYSENGNGVAAARTLRSKGAILERLGRVQEASGCYREALGLLLD